MITAKNYAAQAERGLLLFAAHQKACEEDRKFAKVLSETIHNSEHFVIPDDGKVFDDKLKGLAGKRIELPYEAITVEFYLSGKRSSNPGKAIVVATQEDDAIVLFAATGFPGKDIWIPEAYAMRVPKDINITGNRNDKKTCSGVVCPGLLKIVGADESLNNIKTFELCFEELIEALSCKNISTDNYQEASPVNSKRIKKGKLPFYETKMLVIDAHASSSNKAGSGGGSHSSPPQRLRRGHIRRLSKGNIWVNSCVVGDSTKGIISKQYSVI